MGYKLVIAYYKASRTKQCKTILVLGTTNYRPS